MRTLLGTGLAACGVAVLWLVQPGQRGNWPTIQFLGDFDLEDGGLAQASFLISNRTDTMIFFHAELNLHELQPVDARRIGTNYLAQSPLRPHETQRYGVTYTKGRPSPRAIIGYLAAHTRWQKRRAQWAQWLIKRNRTTEAAWLMPPSPLREVSSSVIWEREGPNPR